MPHRAVTHTDTDIEARHGFAGGAPNVGDLGAMSGPRTTSTIPEKRHGSAGALRRFGGLGAMSGPPS